MKIERITKKDLMATMEKEHLAKSKTFVDKAEIVREPGVIGVGKTPAGNYMVYCTNEKGKLFNTSVHANRREANGMVLRRFRAMATA